MSGVVEPAGPPVEEPARPPEPTHLERVRRHGMMYAVGILISRAAGFVMLPVYTRYLSPADYGILQLIDLTFEVVIIFAGARLSAGVFHFYHKSTDERERRAVLITTLVMMIVSYGLVTAIAFIAAPTISEMVFRTPEHADLLRIGATGLFFQALILVPLAYMQVREWSGRYVLATTVKLLLQLAINIYTIIWLGMGIKGVLVSALIGNLLAGVLLAGFMVRDLGVVFSWSAARAVYLFCLPLITMQVATLVTTFGDRYFLHRSYPDPREGESAVGIYGLAYQFGFLLNAIGFAPFFRVWDPLRFEIAKRPDRDRLYARGFISLNVIYLTVAVAVALMVYDFLRVMAAPAFLGAAMLAPVIMLAYVLQGWTDFQNIGLLITERTGLLSLANWIAAGVSIVGFIVLIPRYHAAGAAVTTVLAFAVRHTLVFRMSQRLWPVRYEWNPVLKLLLLGLGTVGVAMMLPALPLLWSVAARTGLFALYCLLVWSTDIMNESEREFVRRLIRSPRTAMERLRASALGPTP